VSELKYDILVFLLLSKKTLPDMFPQGFLILAK